MSQPTSDRGFSARGLKKLLGCGQELLPGSGPLIFRDFNKKQQPNKQTKKGTRQKLTTALLFRSTDRLCQVMMKR